MPVIAVINRKGGSGKSTLATHLAACCAVQGIPVMLGDVDKQQSAQAWLKLRRAQNLPERAPIVGWTVDPRNTLRPPAGITRVVLDTPGGLRGFDLARVVMSADAILMPVCNSVFDRDSAAQCHAELMTLPRVASGRCRVAAVGMRLDARTKAVDVLQAWAQGLGLPFIGTLRETQAYVRCIEQGLTLFDLPASQVQADMAQWQPILDWLAPLWHAAQPAPRDSVARPTPRAASPRAVAPAVSVRAREAPRAAAAVEAAVASRSAPPARKLFGWLPIPRFLQRRTARSPGMMAAMSSMSWADTAGAR